MEDMGMTDLQFKSFLKLLVRQLEEATEEKEAEDIRKQINKVLEDLNDMLQG